MTPQDRVRQTCLGRFRLRTALEGGGRSTYHTFTCTDNKLLIIHLTVLQLFGSTFIIVNFVVYDNIDAGLQHACFTFMIKPRSPFVSAEIVETLTQLYVLMVFLLHKE